MSNRKRLLFGPLLGACGVLLAGCSGAASIADPTGVAFVDRLLAFLASPNVAYLLLVLGLLAIIAEVTTPGATAPGVAGAIMLILALYGLLQLPTNWLGPVLIVAGVVMLLLDIKVTGFALSIGGLIAFALGSLLIFPPPWASVPPGAAPVSRVDPWLIAAMTVGVGLFFVFGIAAVLKAQRRPVAVGRETMIGKTGIARGHAEPDRLCPLEGEEWSADSVEESGSGWGTRAAAVAGPSRRQRPSRAPAGGPRSARVPVGRGRRSRARGTDWSSRAQLQIGGRPGPSTR